MLDGELRVSQAEMARLLQIAMNEEFSDAPEVQSVGVAENIAGCVTFKIILRAVDVAPGPSKTEQPR